MHYKYEKIVTQGANGTSLSYRNEETNPSMELGKIGSFTYLYTLNPIDMATQHATLVFTELTLTDSELAELSTQHNVKQMKQNARDKIRRIKSLEDDLTDQKQLLQFMARGLMSLWDGQPQQAKDANPHKANFDAFSLAVTGGSFRLDLETDQAAKISEIMQDEADFAVIANDEYLSKL